MPSRFDIHAPREPLRQTLLDTAAQTMAGGMFILGPEVEAFEREFAAYLESSMWSASRMEPTQSRSRCGPWAWRRQQG